MSAIRDVILIHLKTAQLWNIDTPTATPFPASLVQLAAHLAVIARYSIASSVITVLLATLSTLSISTVKNYVQINFTMTTQLSSANNVSATVSDVRVQPPPIVKSLHRISPLKPHLQLLLSIAVPMPIPTQPAHSASATISLSFTTPLINLAAPFNPWQPRNAPLVRSTTLIPAHAFLAILTIFVKCASLPAHNPLSPPVSAASPDIISIHRSISAQPARTNARNVLSVPFATCALQVTSNRKLRELISPKTAAARAEPEQYNLSFLSTLSIRICSRRVSYCRFSELTLNLLSTACHLLNQAPQTLYIPLPPLHLDYKIIQSSASHSFPMCLTRPILIQHCCLYQSELSVYLALTIVPVVTRDIYCWSILTPASNQSTIFVLEDIIWITLRRFATR